MAAPRWRSFLSELHPSRVRLWGFSATRQELGMGLGEGAAWCKPDQQEARPETP